MSEKHLLQLIALLLAAQLGWTIYQAYRAKKLLNQAAAAIGVDTTTPTATHLTWANIFA